MRASDEHTEDIFNALLLDDGDNVKGIGTYLLRRFHKGRVSEEWIERHMIMISKCNASSVEISIF